MAGYYSSGLVVSTSMAVSWLPQSSTPSGRRRRSAVQADVDALLGRRRRVDGAILGVEGPPALRIAVHHPARDAVQPGVLERLVGRAEEHGVAMHAQGDRRRVQQDHAVANLAVRQGGMPPWLGDSVRA